MKNKEIIIILVGVIIALAVIAGVMFSQSNVNQTAIEINQTNLTVDDNIFSVKLVDSKGNPLSNEMVGLSIEDDKGNIIVAEEVPLESDTNQFDFDLEKGQYVVKVSFYGNDDYSPCSATYNLNVSKVTPTASDEEIVANEYPNYNPDLGYYRPTGLQGDEWMVVELADGRNVVIAGDGCFEYSGLDSEGYPIRGKAVK